MHALLGPQVFVATDDRIPQNELLGHETTRAGHGRECGAESQSDNRQATYARNRLQLRGRSGDIVYPSIDRCDTAVAPGIARPGVVEPQDVEPLFDRTTRESANGPMSMGVFPSDRPTDEHCTPTPGLADRGMMDPEQLLPGSSEITAGDLDRPGGIRGSLPRPTFWTTGLR